MSTRTTISERIRALREARDWSQAELAKRAGYSNASTIGNIETRGSSNPRNLLRIAKALGVSAYWLETGIGPKEADTDPEQIHSQELRALILRLQDAEINGSIQPEFIELVERMLDVYLLPTRKKSATQHEPGIQTSMIEDAANLVASSIANSAQTMPTITSNKKSTVA